MNEKIEEIISSEDLIKLKKRLDKDVEDADFESMCSEGKQSTYWYGYKMGLLHALDLIYWYSDDPT